jgi:hypothetical protein
MGVNGQRQASATLYPRGKDPRYPQYRRLGGPQIRSGHRDKRKHLLPLSGIEPRSPGPPVHSPILCWLSYLGPKWLWYSDYIALMDSLTNRIGISMIACIPRSVIKNKTEYHNVHGFVTPLWNTWRISMKFRIKSWQNRQFHLFMGVLHRGVKRGWGVTLTTHTI